MSNNPTSNNPTDNSTGQAVTLGVATLVYAVIWLVIFIAGFLFTSQLIEHFLRVAWFATLAGGIGATVGIFYSLYWHLVMKKDFEPKFFWHYVPQPMIGVILGAAAYFIILAGSMAMASIIPSFQLDPSDFTVTSLQIVTGWIFGFRHRDILVSIKRIMQRLLPTKTNLI